VPTAPTKHALQHFNKSQAATTVWLSFVLVSAATKQLLLLIGSFVSNRCQTFQTDGIEGTVSYFVYVEKGGNVRTILRPLSGENSTIQGALPGLMVD
jgi:hypothetical protein